MSRHWAQYGYWYFETEVEIGSDPASGRKPLSSRTSLSLPYVTKTRQTTLHFCSILSVGPLICKADLAKCWVLWGGAMKSSLVWVKPRFGGRRLNLRWRVVKPRLVNCVYACIIQKFALHATWTQRLLYNCSRWLKCLRAKKTGAHADPVVFC